MKHELAKIVIRARFPSIPDPNKKVDQVRLRLTSKGPGDVNMGRITLLAYLPLNGSSEVDADTISSKIKRGVASFLKIQESDVVVIPLLTVMPRI